MTEQTGAGKLWTDCQCKPCHVVDYVPVASTVVAPFKIVGGLGWGTVWGTVAGVNRTVASILRYNGNNGAANRWQARAGRACKESTKGFMKAGRATVAAVPIVGNGILLGIDAGTKTGGFAPSASEPPGQERSWSPSDSQRPTARRPDSSPAEPDVENGISARRKRAKRSSARTGSSTESSSRSSHGVGSEESSRVSGRWQDDGESTVRETTTEAGLSDDESVVRTAAEPDMVRVTEEDWKAEADKFLRNLSLVDPPSNVMERLGLLIQDFERNKLEESESLFLKSYKDLLDHLNRGSPSTVELLCDQFKPEKRAREMTIAELLLVKVLFEYANVTKASEELLPLLELRNTVARRESEGTSNGNGNTSGSASAREDSEPFDMPPLVPPTDSTEESPSAIRPRDNAQAPFKKAARQWQATVDDFLKTVSVAAPPTNVVQSANSLLQDYEEKGLVQCRLKSIIPYKQLLDYLLGGGNHSRLERLCDHFNEDTRSDSLTRAELSEIERLLTRVDALNFPFGEEVHLLYRFSKRGLDPRSSDLCTLMPIQNAVVANCGSTLKPHYFSEDSLKKSIGSIGLKCPVCKNALPPSPNSYRIDNNVRQMEQAYATYQDARRRVTEGSSAPHNNTDHQQDEGSSSSGLGSTS
jgi:hypothetical protein